MKLGIKDKNIIDYVREDRDGFICLYGLVHKDGCNGGSEVHHIIKRSALRLDVEMNLINLCTKHHQMAENQKISQEELFEILEDFYKYDYAEFRTQYSAFILNR